MEGNRQLVIYEPTPGRNVGGQIAPGEPIRHIAWGIRRDRGGGERLTADTQIGEWQTSFRVRREGLARIDHTWSVVDDEGAEWDIERVAEIPMPPRRWLTLYCVRRT